MVLCTLAGLGGALARDQVLARDIKRRKDSAARTFPAVAELLALAVAAGETPAAAVERVARTCAGPLAEELRRAGADARSGTPLPQALDEVARRLDLQSLRRFADGVTTAVERGTPLADVLHAQAADARAEAHRALLETAGRKEVLMLFPVVFLVLPTVVLVALFPGLASLTLTVS